MLLGTIGATGEISSLTAVAWRMGLANRNREYGHIVARLDARTGLKSCRL